MAVVAGLRGLAARLGEFSLIAQQKPRSGSLFTHHFENAG
jgi:hypothetical protein